MLLTTASEYILRVHCSYRCHPSGGAPDEQKRRSAHQKLSRCRQPSSLVMKRPLRASPVSTLIKRTKSRPPPGAGGARSGARHGGISSRIPRNGSGRSCRRDIKGRRGKDRFKIRGLFADEWCSRAVLDFLACTDVGLRIPDTAEDNAERGIRVGAQIGRRKGRRSGEEKRPEAGGAGG